MGRDQVEAIAARLIALERLSDTPAIAVENAGYPAARAIPASLDKLADAVTAAAPTGPVVILTRQSRRAARSRLELRLTNAADVDRLAEDLIAATLRTRAR